MPPIRNLLTRGNGKLGEGIHAWSLPAVETCPGRTELCSRACYARTGRFRTRAMQSRLAENLLAARSDDFAARVSAEIRQRGVHHPEDRERFLEVTGESIRSGEPYEAKYRIVQSDGISRWVVARGRWSTTRREVRSAFLGFWSTSRS